MIHDVGGVYMLHSCGQLSSIYDSLIDEVKIDAKQSFEDVILPVEDFYKSYGGRVAAIGGIDIDLLSRGSEDQVRDRVRQVLMKCQSNGRYALGSGNTISNYCKKENILAMFDEAFRY